MGYDMQSEAVAGDEGYFRLNIYGMSWMRQIMEQAGIHDAATFRKFSSNDGWLVGKKLGKRIAGALNTFLRKNPVGTKYSMEGTAFGKDQLPPKAKIKSRHTMGKGIAYFFYEEQLSLTDQDHKLIKEFAEYNDTKAPYRVW